MATTSNFGWPTPDDTDLVKDGASAIRSLGSAIDTTVAAGYRYAGTRYYTSSGTFAKADPLGTGDIGLRAVIVRCVGAGGGGGGAEITGAGQVAAGNGGSGGGFGQRFILASTLTTSVTVTRGAGGAGGSGNAAGTAGNASSFGAGEAFEVIGDGGSGGNRLGAHTPGTLIINPGIGGAAGAGEFVFRGMAGVPMILFGSGGSSALSGSGGSSTYGSGSNSQSTSADGSTGTLYGGGGAGALNLASQGTARDGGAGANGIVIVDCFV